MEEVFPTLEIYSQYSLYDPKISIDMVDTSFCKDGINKPFGENLSTIYIHNYVLLARQFLISEKSLSLLTEIFDNLNSLCSVLCIWRLKKNNNGLHTCFQSDQKLELSWIKSLLYMCLYVRGLTTF